MVSSKRRKQPNGNDFGYYVMKNILDIISANIAKSWMEVKWDVHEALVQNGPKSPKELRLIVEVMT
ncbi:hypothetical protein MTR_4g066300 [Medicago truncatula]|uniref:Ulp1 protease family, carboxy-terminal domain protein n=1 Tax=Medicago truncatula TaxID=3880 RepID=A0A072UKK8_MEDTR|nr:hypothetical protein MTR_4g066300 [Medicago truncatula]